MRETTIRTTVNGLIVILAIALIGGLSYWIWWGSTRPPVIERAANWSLKNVSNGQQETLQSLGLKVKLVEFIFVNCADICPTTTVNMVSMQEDLKKRKLFGSEVAFVGITFDPERDTPEVIQRYANNLKVDWSGWSFYRGTEEETQNVLADYKIPVEKQPDGSYLHPVRSLFLIDRNNNVRKIYSMGEKMDREEILKDIVRLTKE